jgi:methionine synthase I (cobalamin-dependent)
MINNPVQQLISSQKVVLLDGAMGTMLMAAGLESGEAPELWNVLHPEVVRNIHREYIQAGSDLILTNTFGGNRVRLKLHDLDGRTTELNRAGAELARSAADQADRSIVVGGSIGPTGELLEPVGTLEYGQARQVFAEQAQALMDGGVEVLWIETMSDLNEVKAAIEGCRQISELPVAATMTFDSHGHTMMGVTPEAAINILGELELMVVGANCGNGPAEIEAVIEKMRRINPDAILVAKANAGIPKWEGDELIYDGTPEVMADYAVKVHKLGAKFIGGCCGSTPAHISAMASALKENTPS